MLTSIETSGNEAVKHKGQLKLTSAKVIPYLRFWVVK